MITEQEAIKKLYELADQFKANMLNRQYQRAKYCYDKARDAAVFCEINEKEMIKIFGSRQDEKNPVDGVFSERQVQKAYEKCIFGK